MSKKTFKSCPCAWYPARKKKIYTAVKRSYIAGHICQLFHFALSLKKAKSLERVDSVTVSLFVFISDLTNSTIVLLWDEQACLGTCGPIDLNFWFNPWFWPNVTKVFLDSFPYLWKNNGNHEQRYDKWTSLIPQSLLVHNYGGGSYIQRVIGHINAFWTFHKSVTNETRYEQPLLYDSIATVG